METTSIIAIYVLFWTISAFIVLPFGVKRNDEMGVEDVAGQELGAPANFRPLRILLWTTILATAAFGIFYMNYVNQWLTLDSIDVFNSRSRI